RSDTLERPGGVGGAWRAGGRATRFGLRKPALDGESRLSGRSRNAAVERSRKPRRVDWRERAGDQPTDHWASGGIRHNSVRMEPGPGGPALDLRAWQDRGPDRRWWPGNDSGVPDRRGRDWVRGSQHSSGLGRLRILFGRRWGVQVRRQAGAEHL